MERVENIISKRYSVRKYSSRKVEKDKIRDIFESVRLAPSTCNSQPWRFIVIENTEDFCDYVFGGVVPNKWAYSAPIIVVCCVKKDILAHYIASTVKGTNFAMIDMGIALEHLILKATDLGLGSCIIGWFDKGKVRKMLKIPKLIGVVALVTLGYPEKDESRAKNRQELDEILYFNKWGGSERESP